MATLEEVPVVSLVPTVVVTVPVLEFSLMVIVSLLFPRQILIVPET